MSRPVWHCSVALAKKCRKKMPRKLDEKSLEISSRFQEIQRLVWFLAVSHRRSTQHGPTRAFETSSRTRNHQPAPICRAAITTHQHPGCLLVLRPGDTGGTLGKLTLISSFSVVTPKTDGFPLAPSMMRICPANLFVQPKVWCPLLVT